MRMRKNFRKRTGILGDEDFEKDSCLKVRKQKNAESVRSAGINNSAYRNGACWRLQVR